MNRDRIQIKRYDNGLVLAFYKMPEMKSVSIGVYIRAGSRYEKKEINGISHFLEHILFKGTEKRNALQISREIEGIGGILNGFTSEETTCYYVKVLKDYFSKGLEILLDMVLNPLLKSDDIEKEKGIIIEELNMYLDMPSQYVDDMLTELMWENHPLGRRILGSEDTINSMTSDKLKEYKDEFYTSSNIVVSVAGDLDWPELQNELDKYSSFFKDGKKNDFVRYNNIQNEPNIAIKISDTEQTHIAVGFKVKGRNDNEKYIAKIASIILGENMSSRLFQNVREKEGLAYEIHSNLNLMKDVGAFEVSAGVKNSELEKAVITILKEIAGMKTRISSEEIEMAKRYLMGTYLLSVEQTRNSMLKMGENLIVLENVETFDDIKSNCEKIGIDDIVGFAEKYFKPDNANFAVYGKEISKKTVENLIYDNLG